MRTATLLVGKEAGRNTVFTVHPGPPARIALVKSTPALLGKSITVAEARALGFTLGNATPIDSN